VSQSVLRALNVADAGGVGPLLSFRQSSFPIGLSSGQLDLASPTPEKRKKAGLRIFSLDPAPRFCHGVFSSKKKLLQKI
jgi:hypothetical protein